MKKTSLGKILLLILAAIVLYFVLKEPAVDAAAHHPEPGAEMQGPFAENNILLQAEILQKEEVDGPEGLAVDDSGNIYAGVWGGDVIRISPEGEKKVLVNTGGRPLGLELDKTGNLFICDSYKGLLEFTKDGKLNSLATEADGVPFGFTDDLAVARDGKIYFSDASYKYGQEEYLYDALEGRGNGRLLVYDPKTKETKTLLDNLFFANGVALSQDESFVIVNETYKYRIQRYWLKGPKKNTAEIFVDHLPGFPDNTTSDGKGNFYVAFFTVRNSALDSLHPHPGLKEFVSKLPKFLWPKPQPYGFVGRLNEKGEFLESYQDPSGDHIKEITSAFSKNGSLYLGSLHNHYIGKLDLSNSAQSK